MNHKTNRKGLIHVYTGNGKGKTTAAVGQAFRALGHGWRVRMIQFMKHCHCGEVEQARRTKNFEIEQFGNGFIIGKIKKEDVEMAKKGMERAHEIIANNDCDLLILDEINIAMDYGLIGVEEVIKLMKAKPPEMELILTGRNAPKEIIRLADLVTEMKEIKHPYKRGITAREGIEY